MCLPALAVLLLLAAGCGDDERESRAGEDRLGAGTPPGRTIVAALGDSISAGSPLWDPDPAIRARIAEPDEQSQYEFWAERRLDGTSFRNCGVFGERTDQIARRLERCAQGADVLVVQGGINDIAQMRRVATAARSLRAMVRRGRELRLRVGLVEVLPWNNGYPFASRRIAALNREIAAIGREERVPVSAWYAALEDPAAPGRVRADLTIDGDHPSVAGYRLLAERLRLP